MSIAIDKTSTVTGKMPVEVPNGAGKLTLYARELGYLQAMAIFALIRSDRTQGLAMLVAESVIDGKGEKFTVEEVLNLRKEVAEPLFDAVFKINKLQEEDKEKN